MTEAHSATFGADLDGWPGELGKIKRGACPDSGEVVV
jgi:hypothetical protein